jgi:hypothetical protein
VVPENKRTPEETDMFSAQFGLNFNAPPRTFSKRKTAMMPPERIRTAAAAWNESLHARTLPNRELNNARTRSEEELHHQNEARHVIEFHQRPAARNPN